MKTKIAFPPAIEDTSLADLCITRSTITRLHAEGIRTLGDLIAAEEKKTLRILAKKTLVHELVQKKEDESRKPLGELNTTESARQALLGAKITTVKKLLRLSAMKLYRVRNLGIRSMTQILVDLVQKGYAGNPGRLLHDPDTIFYLQSAEARQEMCELELAGILKQPFKDWYARNPKARSPKI